MTEPNVEVSQGLDGIGPEGDYLLKGGCPDGGLGYRASSISDIVGRRWNICIP